MTDVSGPDFRTADKGKSRHDVQVREDALKIVFQSDTILYQYDCDSLMDQWAKKLRQQIVVVD